MKPTSFFTMLSLGAILFISLNSTPHCALGAELGSESMVTQDSDLVFESPNKNFAPTPKVVSLLDAWGVDVLISNNGFGLGGFLRHQYSEDLYGTLNLGISESKDDNEVEYVTYYGETYVPGKINRFIFVPLHVGVEYRLFADDIVDNFRPYVNAALGPSLVFSSPYDREFFNSIGYGQAHYSVGGFVGFGAFFGSEETLSGVNIRYYVEPFHGGIDSMMRDDGSIEKKKDFGGFFITLNFGSLF
ncbi:MAG TPA: hypothetical protein VMM58_04860 [Bacteroidota bacterium]|nr:hypothetical protein [Bacteroidota bacterium]